MPSARPSVIAIFFAALKLGCTSFGGPIAHLGYFRNEYVARRGWISDEDFAELVALCQFLPGPASSQVGFGVGLLTRGLAGGVAAWLGFTLPSAMVMTLFAFGIGSLRHPEMSGWLGGLKVAAAAVVAQAVLAMGRRLCPDLPRAVLAAVAAAAVTFAGGTASQVGVLAGGALIGGLWLRSPPTAAVAGPALRRRGAIWLVAFLVLLAVLPALAHAFPAGWMAVADRFYRTGSLVFGGGHTVVPLLGQQVVAAGWVPEDRFVAGYGFVQAMPGPLFSFAAYLGALLRIGPGGWLGAAWALGWLFLPGLLLVGGVLPWWNVARRSRVAGGAVAGVNAAIVGVLLAALVDPVVTSSLLGPREWIVAGSAFAALQIFRAPSWLVVIACAAAGGSLL
ncbi:MAG TPA: chromate efflux transporter [Candidatus Didemnitutus sp.]|jgi:chromate transporter